MLFSSSRDIPDLLPLLNEAPTIKADMQVDELHDYLLSRPDILCLPVLQQARLDV